MSRRNFRSNPLHSSRGRAGHIPEVARLIPRAEQHLLDNGLTVVLVPTDRAPVVAHALAYRAGARDEAPGLGGTAHFLEHMMFKGAERFGAGEIDRLTQSLGGVNNAFTSHDLTLYYFTFAADRWSWALEVERDRMDGLLLEKNEVDSERRVILEEISMYQSEPWDALDEAVRLGLFPEHAYGRPVLGTREELAGIDRSVLADFHGSLYRPEHAVLSIVGDLDADRALEEVRRQFEGVGSAGPPSTPSARAVAQAGHRSGPSRLERRQGELARLLVALPAPAGDHPDHPALRLLLSVLGSGRSCRLHRALVDEGQHCVWVTTDLQESLDPGMLVLAAEAVPGSDPAIIEAQLLSELEALRQAPPSPEELARAQRMEVADWLFGHEKVDQVAFLAATSCCLFDLDHPARYLERLFNTTPEDLLRVAQTYLDPDRSSVIGWSLPE